MTSSFWVVRLIVIALPPRDAFITTIAQTVAPICKTVAVDVIGPVPTKIVAFVPKTAAAASPAPMLPKMFANPAPIAVGMETNARTTVATGAAISLISRIVAIQTDVPSSSPRTQTLIVSVLLMLVTIVLHPRVTKMKANALKEAVSGTQCLEATAIVTSRALM